MSGTDKSISEVPVTTVYDALERGEGVLVDVREQEEIDEVTVEGITHIPMEQIPSRVSELPTDADVYIICRSGQRSAMVTEFLQQQGYPKVHNVEGGMIAWVKANLPVRWGR